MRVMVDPKEFLVENLALIQDVVSSIGWRKGMNAAEIEEFAAEVRLRLIDNDCAIVRRFNGRSSFKTYIAAVIVNIYLDERNRQWGKWHPSAEATKAGSLGVDLERLIVRDGKTVEEALVELAPTYPDVTTARLQELALRFPPRTRRRIVSLEEARDVETGGHRRDPERNETAQRISTVVKAFIDALPENEQDLLKLRFASEMTVAQISRALHIDQQTLYRSFYKHFAGLRAVLEKAGVSAQDIESLIGNDTVLLDFHLKKPDPRPSDGGEGEDKGRQENVP